jgi:hypothetical protein
LRALGAAGSRWHHAHPAFVSFSTCSGCSGSWSACAYPVLSIRDRMQRAVSPSRSIIPHPQSQRPCFCSNRKTPHCVYRCAPYWSASPTGETGIWFIYHLSPYHRRHSVMPGKGRERKGREGFQGHVLMPIWGLQEKTRASCS